MQQPALNDILRNPAIWRFGQVTQAPQESIPTGFPQLDQILPDQGWPVGAMVELLADHTGMGELTLLAPALRSIAGTGRGIALLAPAHLPYPPAWEAAGISLNRMMIVEARGIELLWAAEQILRSGECGAVLLWAHQMGRILDHRALQRLHMAAGKGKALCVSHRPTAAQSFPSPAPLRLTLSADAGGIAITPVKLRGRLNGKPVKVRTFPRHWATLNIPLRTEVVEMFQAAQGLSA